MAEFSRKEQRGWFFYDWANSAFSTTVVTLFLGPYLTSLAKNAADAKGLVYPLGLPISAQSVWPYLVSLAVFVQIFVLPVAGAIADYGHRKREMLGVCAFVGAGATMTMFFLQGSNYLLGCALFLIANSAFGASIVIYNSFLPEIAAPDERDSVSSKGFGLGYIGGGLLLVLNILLYQKAESIGISESTAVRISLMSAGLWWALFTLIPLAVLKNRAPSKRPPEGKGYVGAALLQLRHTFAEIMTLPQTMKFLIGYLIYNDAIQTVLTLAAAFGQEELKLPVEALTVAILLAQFVGFVGAMFFNWVSSKLGSKRTVMITLAIYCFVLIYAYAGVQTKTEFYILSSMVGAVMGGSQALSRSLFSFMIPKGHEAEYFSIYEISDKGTSWLGPLFFGLALQMTGSYRISILSLIVFFIAGLVFLYIVDVKKAAMEAGNEPPVL